MEFYNLMSLQIVAGDRFDLDKSRDASLMAAIR